MAAFFIAVFGLIAGSFLSALTYRLQHEDSILRGRSNCDKCKKQISWFDNIPLISYLLLGGKCRNCKKQISLRYPVIEFATSAIFIFTYLFVADCGASPSPICDYSGNISYIPFLLLLMSFVITIFVTDLESKFIPDSVSLGIFGLSFFVVLFSSFEDIYVRLLSGFAAASFLLIIHLITKGKGMGLGDVKLAIGLGFLLPGFFTLTWMVLSFVLGSVVGIVLMFLNKAQFGKHIPFAPFLISSFIVVLFWGDTIVSIIFPYFY